MAGVDGRGLSLLNQVAPLEAALAYARLGLPVFPVAPVDQTTGLCRCRDGPGCEQVGKHPLVRWADNATTDPVQIHRWWGSWKPDANIGIPTGQRSGLVVVDIDRQHGGLATRQAIEALGHVFQPTLAARTRNGGWHFFYEAPADRQVPNTTAALAGVGAAPGIDVRGDGGYIIVAPSIRPIDPDPDTGAVRFGRYAWAAQDHRIAPAPNWVTTPKQRPSSPAPTGPSAVARGAPGHKVSHPEKRAEAALAAETRRVTDSRGQGRNNCLFQAAANLFEIVNTGWLSEERVRSELTAAAVSVGLGEREIAQTLDAQWRRKQGVRRAGWDSAFSPNQDPMGFRRSKTVLDTAVPHQSRGGFGR